MSKPKITRGRSGRRYAARASHPNAGIPANTFIKAKAEIHSYEDAAAFLGDEVEREIGSNVRIVRTDLKGRRRQDASISVRLYATDIITYYPGGTFNADNGGYFTPTTSSRATQFGPEGWYFGHHECRLFGRYGSGEDVVVVTFPFDGLVPCKPKPPREGDVLVLPLGGHVTIERCYGPSRYAKGRAQAGLWTVKVHGSDRLYYCDPGDDASSYWIAGGEDFDDDDPYRKGR